MKKQQPSKDVVSVKVQSPPDPTRALQHERLRNVAPWKARGAPARGSPSVRVTAQAFLSKVPLRQVFRKGKVVSCHQATFTEAGGTGQVNRTSHVYCKYPPDRVAARIKDRVVHMTHLISTD